MTDVFQPCSNPERFGFDVQKVADETWETLLSAGVFVEGNFTFASGIKSTLKVDAERLYAKPDALQKIIGFFATFPCVRLADALLYVPSGMTEFTRLLGNELDKPVVDIQRKLDAKTRYEFQFATQADKELALNATRPIITEDVVTTLGSVAGVRTLLGPDQDVHSLAILLRGQVNPQYQTGLVDHYLLTREIPNDKNEFRRLWPRL